MLIMIIDSKFELIIIKIIIITKNWTIVYC